MRRELLQLQHRRALNEDAYGLDSLKAMIQMAKALDDIAMALEALGRRHRFVGPGEEVDVHRCQRCGQFRDHGEHL